MRWSVPVDWQVNGAKVASGKRLCQCLAQRFEAFDLLFGYEDGVWVRRSIDCGAGFWVFADYYEFQVPIHQH
ncbi:hypothetical protein NONI108955_40445 [Nocardia ninae]